MSRIKTRSPSYPILALPDAIEKARSLYAYAPHKPIPVDSALNQWEYKPRSGAGFQSLSALIKYGLLSQEGKRDRRSVKLTPLALEILLPDQEHDTKHLEAIRESAFAPRIHSEIKERWPAGLPADSTIRTWLEKEKRFNPAAIPGFLKQLRSTFELAYTESGTILDDKENDKNAVEVGDFVQWQTQGALRLPKPGKVERFSDDGEFAFLVGGSATGMPVAELIVVSAPATEQQDRMPEMPLPPTLGTIQEVFAVDGAKIVITWPDRISKASFEDVKAWIPILQRKIGRCVSEDG